MTPSYSFISRRRKAAFTMAELMVAVTLSTMVVAAIMSLSIAAIRTYHVESDYLEIGGQSRRLNDELIEQGTFADDLAVFRDIAPAQRILVSAGDRGDCLMIYDRATSGGTGNITSFVCYYLAYTSATGSTTRPVSLWRFESDNNNISTFTPDPTTALTNYPRKTAQRVSGDIFTGFLPRVMPATTTPITPREGIFTNDGFRAGGSPTVLINMPTRSSVKGVTTLKVTGNTTFAISPRR